MQEAVPLGLMTSSMCGLWVVLIAVQIVFSLVIGVISIAGLVLWVLMLVDVIQRDEKTFKSGDERLVWILIVILAGWVGSLIYYLVEYRKHKGLKSGQLI